MNVIERRKFNCGAKPHDVVEGLFVEWLTGVVVRIGIMRHLPEDSDEN